MRIRGSGTGTCYPTEAPSDARTCGTTARRCVICGRVLRGRRRKYCSGPCEAVAVARKANERYRASIPEPEGSCPVCGRRLEKGMRRYCSRACARSARESYQRAYQRKYRKARKGVGHVCG